jgi:hypothetical protein
MQRKTVEPGCPRLRSLFAKQTIARRNEKMVRPSQDLWAWVYFSSHPRLFPERSVPSRGSVFGGRDLWPAGQRAAASSGVIQTKARFAETHVSAVRGSKGRMPANP